MKSLIPSLVLFLGVCLACVGLWWVWTGLEIVQVERGWASVIAGSTMLSAGFVIGTLSAVLARLGDIADALADAAQVRPIDTAETASPSASPKAANATLPVDAPDVGGKQIVGRHVAEDATYVMFADGSVDAQTSEGTMTFPSLEALRTYADEREASAARETTARS